VIKHIISYTGLWRGHDLMFFVRTLYTLRRGAKGAYDSDREHRAVYPAKDPYKEVVIQ